MLLSRCDHLPSVGRTMAAYLTLAPVKDALGGHPQEMTDWLRGKDIIGGLLRANLHLAQYVAQVRTQQQSFSVD